MQKLTALGALAEHLLIVKYGIHDLERPPDFRVGFHSRQLFRAARPEKIHLHRLDRRTGERVHQVFVPSSPPPQLTSATVPGPSLVVPKALAKTSTPATEPPQPLTLPPADLVKGFEFEKNRYVAFEPEELEELAPKTSADMQIVEFVRFDQVDPIYLESSYYLAADKGGEKPYALLFAALKKTGYAAIAELVMHRRDQTMILRPNKDGVVAHTLFYEDEVKRENAFHADPALVSEKELDLAIKLVDALKTEWDPAKFKDKFRERLQGAIAGKMENLGSVGPIPEPAKAPVVDLMAALAESLKNLKKPASSERATHTAELLSGSAAKHGSPAAVRKSGQPGRRR